MKGFWQSHNGDTLRIVRLVSLTLAFVLLFAAVYLSGWYSPAAAWAAMGMFFTAGIGSLCTAGIAAQKLFRSAAPHLVFTGICWVAAMYIVAFVL